MVELKGSASPSDSAIEPIVDAVPMVMQWPAERDMQDSASLNSSSVILPTFTSSLNFQTEVPEPMSLPRNLPFSIGPPETTMAGTSQLAAPMINDGVVLSQPHISTTPSIGLARIDSSTSMLTRLRKSMAVGRILVSPVDMTGNSSGKPPDSHTPRFTRSASARRCALQGVSSDQVLQIPMTGRPSKTSSGKPWLRIQLRWMNPSLSVRPNQAAERNFCFSSDIFDLAFFQFAIQRLVIGIVSGNRFILALSSSLEAKPARAAGNQERPR